MDIEVDLDLCQGHGLCVRYAPSVFAFDDDAGQSYPLRASVTSDQDIDAAKLGAGGCPERAITLR